MKLLTIIEALVPLCLLLAEGFPVLEDRAPEIIRLKCAEKEDLPGQQLFLSCEAYANYDVEETLIYWLVNGSFPEDAPSSDRIEEMEEHHFEDEAILQRSLWLKNITKDDLTSTFTCVVKNAAGKAQRHMTLTHTSDYLCEENA